MSKMFIKALFIQRKERYEGEYGPELIDAVDEYTDDENPSYFEEKVKKAQENVASGEYAGMSVVRINVDQDEIRRRCLGDWSPLEGEFQKDEDDELPRYMCPECHIEMPYDVSGECHKCEKCGHEDRDES